MKQLKRLIDKIGRDRLVILLIGGLLILVISIPTNQAGREGREAKDVTDGLSSKKTAIQSDKTGHSGYDTSSGTDYAAYLEKKLQGILQNIDGAGQVRVMVTLSDAGGYVVEKDISYKREGESQRNSDGIVSSSSSTEDSEKTVFTVDEKGNSIPLVSKQILPSVEGILIIAQGGGRADVKSEMKQAVLSLFNLDEHKISIVKMKGKNG